MSSPSRPIDRRFRVQSYSGVKKHAHFKKLRHAIFGSTYGNCCDHSNFHTILVSTNLQAHGGCRGGSAILPSAVPVRRCAGSASDFGGVSYGEDNIPPPLGCHWAGDRYSDSSRDSEQPRVCVFFPFNPLPPPGNRPFGRKWNIAPVCPGSPPSTIPVFPPVD